MIRLTDFMQIPEPARTKVKFNIRAGSNGVAAWDLLLDDDPEEWLNMSRYRSRQQNNNLGNAEYLLSFAQYYPYGAQYYIFGGYFRVEKTYPEIINGHGYRLEALPRYDDYIKRLIVKLAQPIGRNLYLRKLEGLQEGQLNPEVYELAPDTKLGSFPGYQHVRLRHHELQRIIRNAEPSWRDALSSVKGVYVVTDLSSGRLYVGSASGEANGLWQRWSNYAQVSNLSGGNREFEDMKLDLGSQHLIDHFQYAILEIFDPKTSAATILQREAFWKQSLDSRAHGMNRN